MPTDLELIDACSSHWFTLNPPPDPAPWTEISDPGRRAEAILHRAADKPWGDLRRDHIAEHRDRQPFD